jgi:prevent-host-death family protein
MTARQVSAAEFKVRCLRIINEMNRDRGTVTITKRGRPVAVLSLVSASDEETPPFIGMMRGTVLKYEEPFQPAASPSDWSVLR